MTYPCSRLKSLKLLLCDDVSWNGGDGLMKVWGTRPPYLPSLTSSSRETFSISSNISAFASYQSNQSRLVITRPTFWGGNEVYGSEVPRRHGGPNCPKPIYSIAVQYSLKITLHYSASYKSCYQHSCFAFSISFCDWNASRLLWLITNSCWVIHVSFFLLLCNSKSWQTIEWGGLLENVESIGCIVCTIL